MPFNPTAAQRMCRTSSSATFLPKIARQRQPGHVVEVAQHHRHRLDDPAQPIPMIDNNAVSPGPGTGPSGLATADMDGDGISDVVVALSGTDQSAGLLERRQRYSTAQPAMECKNNPKAWSRRISMATADPTSFQPTLGPIRSRFCTPNLAVVFLPMGFVKRRASSGAPTDQRHRQRRKPGRHQRTSRS